jgi:hypothetical protein
MEMKYTSFKAQVLKAMELHKKEFCEGVGVLAVAEIQPITPVGKDYKDHHKGNLKRSIIFDVMPDNAGVYIGANASAPYAIDVEKGIGQTAQPFLEPGAMNAIPKIYNKAVQIYKKMGG